MWVTNQFEHLMFSSLDNAKQIDLRPFFTRSTRRSQPELFEDFSSALEICSAGSLPTYHPFQFGTKPTLPQQAVVLCRFMSIELNSLAWYFRPGSWFFRPDFLGRYAMATGHYEVALQRIAHYLLQLPKHTLLGILNDPHSRKNILETPVICLICRVLNIFLDRSPTTTDLYFLVALTSPVMRSIGNYRASDYLSRVSAL